MTLPALKGCVWFYGLFFLAAAIGIPTVAYRSDGWMALLPTALFLPIGLFCLAYALDRRAGIELDESGLT
ncbi:MAG TPA: hypothetical protein VEI97_20990, partial [bacterium]|nr:hypothetical protein [bacterium]